MADKAPDAFRNISEVSSLLNVPAHVLRFWETRFAQIKPVKRSGGRRYYRPDDIQLLTRIRDLLYSEGYTIKGAQQVLKSAMGASPAAAMLTEAGHEPSGAPSSGAPSSGTEPLAAASSVDLARAMALLSEARTRLDQLSR